MLGGKRAIVRIREKRQKGATFLKIKHYRAAFAAKTWLKGKILANANIASVPLAPWQIDTGTLMTSS